MTLRQMFSRWFLLGIFCVLVLGLLGNLLFLDPFYSWIRTWKSLGWAERASAAGNDSRLVSDQASLEGLTVLILGSDGRPPENPALPGGLLPLPDKLDSLREAGDWFVLEGPIPTSKTPHLSVFYRTEDGRTIIVSSPLAVSRETLFIATVFFAVQSLAGLGLAVLLAGPWARRISKPIDGINRRAQAIASWQLDTEENTIPIRELDSLEKNLTLIAGRLKTWRREEEDRRRFLASVSHELRTPVSVIYGHAEGLAEGIPETEEKKQKYLEVILRQSRKMIRIIEDTLDLQRLEGGDFQVRISGTTLEDVISEIRELAELEYGGYSLEVVIPDTPIGLLLDRERLVQVLWNLVKNSLLHGTEPRRLVCRRDAGALEITISNNLRPSEHAVAGTGLGLRICRAISIKNAWEFSEKLSASQAVFTLRLRLNS